MGFSDLGCYGGEIATPNLDALAAGGLRFTQFYNTARCCPTRASLLTGLYPHQAGVGHMVDSKKGGPGYQNDLNRNCVTIAQALKPAGYRSYAVGKWHVTPIPKDGSEPSRHNWPLQRGFDRFYGFLNGETDQFYPELTRDNQHILPPRSPEEGYHLTEDLIDQSTTWIRDLRSVRPDRPFYLYLAFGAQHAPHHAPDSYLAKWRGAFDEGWDALGRIALMRESHLLVSPDSGPIQLAAATRGAHDRRMSDQSSHRIDTLSDLKYVFKKSLPSWMDANRKSSITDHLYITRFYSLCPSLLDNYLERLQAILANIQQHGIDTEHAHYLCLDRRLVVEFDTIGIEGIMGGTGEREIY